MKVEVVIVEVALVSWQNLIRISEW